MEYGIVFLFTIPGLHSKSFVQNELVEDEMCNWWFSDIKLCIFSITRLLEPSKFIRITINSTKRQKTFDRTWELVLVDHKTSFQIMGCSL